MKKQRHSKDKQRERKVEIKDLYSSLSFTAERNCIGWCQYFEVESPAVSTYVINALAPKRSGRRRAIPAYRYN